jgi:hypothetical protein
MANYHLAASTGSRSSGQSAGAKSDYICREKKYKNRDDELVHSESGNMPNWATDSPREYWDTADTFERSNGRLYKEVEFSLMKEIPLDKQMNSVRLFVKDCTKGESLPYTLAIHKGKDENPHCHLMISERINDGVHRSKEKYFKRYNGKKIEEGGAKKSEVLKPKEWLRTIREKWEHHCNNMLERAGLSERVSCKSLSEQGVEREPQIHLGPNVKAMQSKGIVTDRGDIAKGIQERNEQIGGLVSRVQAIDEGMTRERVGW